MTKSSYVEMFWKLFIFIFNQTKQLYFVQPGPSEEEKVPWGQRFRST
jgi:hypothetical protein